MMHPWDRDQTQRNAQPRSINWISLLLSLLIGLFGFALLFRLSHGGKAALIVPLAFAGIGSLYFLGRGWRGASQRRVEPNDADFYAASGRPLSGNAGKPGFAVTTPPAYASKQAATDTLALRRVFDRFDLLAIERAQRHGLAPAAQASFLTFARDYVDLDHSLALLAERNEDELKQHFTASLERALLAFQNQAA